MNPPPLPPPPDDFRQWAAPVLYASLATPPYKPGRPGLVQSIGILSLCFGVISILINGLGWVRYREAIQFEQARVSRPSAVTFSLATPRPLLAPGLVPYPGDLHGPAGFARAGRTAALALVEEKIGARLSDDRRVMVRRFLGEFGQMAFPGAAADGSAGLAGITEAGQLPAGPDGLRTLGTHYFRTSAGVVLIDDACVRFKPVKRGGDCLVRGTQAQEAGVEREALVVTVEQLDELHKRLGPTFNTMQAATVVRMRTAPPPSYTPPPRNPGDTLLPDAQMRGPVVSFGHNPENWILANGAVTWISDPSQTDPATGMPFPPKPTVAAPVLSMDLLQNLKLDAFICTALGLLLTVCGIVLLAGVRTAGRWHAFYLLLKFAWAPFSIYLVSRVITVAAAHTTGAARTGYFAGAVLGASTTLVYPVVLFFLLRAKTVRDHYALLGGGIAPVAGVIQQSTRGAARKILQTAMGRVATLITCMVALAVVVAESMLLLRGQSVIGGGIWHEETAFRAGAALACAASTAVLFLMFRWSLQKGAGRASPIGRSTAALALFLSAAIGIMQPASAADPSTRPSTAPATQAHLALSPAARALRETILAASDLPAAKQAVLRREIELRAMKGDQPVLDLLSDDDSSVRNGGQFSGRHSMRTPGRRRARCHAPRWSIHG